MSAHEQTTPTPTLDRAGRCSPACPAPTPDQIDDAGTYDCRRCGTTYGLRLDDPRRPRRQASPPADLEDFAANDAETRAELARLGIKSPGLAAMLGGVYEKWRARHQPENRQRTFAEYEAERAGSWRSLYNAALKSGVTRELLSLCASGAVQDTDAARFALKAARERWPVATLVGPPGSGKSVAAAAAVWERVNADGESASVLWVKVRDLAMRAWFGDTREHARDLDELRRRLRSVRLLVLDDLGQEPESVRREGSVWRSELWGLVDDRHGRGLEARGEQLQTIVTAQRKPDQLAAIYGDDVWRRLYTDSGQRIRVLTRRWDVGIETTPF